MKSRKDRGEVKGDMKDRKKKIRAYDGEKFVKRGKWTRTRTRIEKESREREGKKNGKMFLKKNK
jgi:hypothetical protein